MSSLNWSYGEQASYKPVWKQNHKSIDADSNVIFNNLSMLPLVFVISCGNYENSTLTMEKKLKKYSWTQFCLVWVLVFVIYVW